MHGRIVGLILVGTTVLGLGGMARGQQADGSRPVIEVEQKMPARVASGEAVTIEMMVRNTGTAAAENVTVVAALPGLSELLDAAPKPQRESSGLRWALGVVEPGQCREFRLRLASHAAVGELRSSVKATYQTNVRSEAVCIINRPELALRVAGPDAVSPSETARFVIAVQNMSSAPVPDVMLQTVLPAGLAHHGGNDLEIEVGTLGPGQVREITLAVTPTRAGDFRSRICAVSRGVTLIEQEARLHVPDFRLALTANGPRLLYPEWVGSFELSVRNDGPAALKRLAVVVALPPGLATVRASDGGVYEAEHHSVRWDLANLAQGESRTLVWTGVARAVGEQVCMVQMFAGQGRQEAMGWRTSVVAATGEPEAKTASTPKPALLRTADFRVPSAPSPAAAASGAAQRQPATASSSLTPVEAVRRSEQSPPALPGPFAVRWGTDFSK